MTTSPTPFGCARLLVSGNSAEYVRRPTGPVVYLPLLSLFTAPLSAQTREDETVRAATRVMNEIMAAREFNDLAAHDCVTHSSGLACLWTGSYPG